MILVEVDVTMEGDAVAAAADDLAGRLERRRELHQAMVNRVGEQVGAHLRGLAPRSPHTGYYGRAAASVTGEADPERGVVSIPHPGMALHFYGSEGLPGGMVSAGKSTSEHSGKPTRALALPSEDVPVRGGTRLAPSQVGPLAFIPRRKDAPAATAGYLVEARPQVVTRGKRKGGTRMVPIPRAEGGRLMFTLRTATHHYEDPGVLPRPAALHAGAAAAAADFLTALDPTTGGASP